MMVLIFLSFLPGACCAVVGVNWLIDWLFEPKPWAGKPFPMPKASPPPPDRKGGAR